MTDRDLLLTGLTEEAILRRVRAVFRQLEGGTTMDMETFRERRYLGRGFVIGLSDDGKHLVQIYWITGRSEDSQNRVLSHEEGTGRVFTELADSNKLTDPEKLPLILYDAMMECRLTDSDLYVVSNGKQTNAVRDALAQYQRDWFETMGHWEYEPDKPNTPRITGVITLGKVPLIQMCIVKKHHMIKSAIRHLFTYDEVEPGTGYCLTTYDRDVDWLPPFGGEPYCLPIRHTDLEYTMEYYWSSLNEETRVALAVKFIDRASGLSTVKIVNRFQKVNP